MYPPTVAERPFPRGYRRALAVDVELTCWDGPPPEGEDPEVIQVAAVAVDLVTLSVAAPVSVLCRPERSRISPHCTGLTGIDPERMKREGRPFGEACATLRNAFGRSRPWIAWGRDDAVIARECAIKGVAEPPFGDSFLNLGAVWGMLNGLGMRPSLEGAVSELGVGRGWQPHDAASDALAAARVLLAMASTWRAARPRPEPLGPR
jgi:inhibitor of KinA sporulation pathway (predicted exonuclease)